LDEVLKIWLQTTSSSHLWHVSISFHYEESMMYSTVKRIAYNPKYNRWQWWNHEIGTHGRKVIAYNLWLNDVGQFISKAQLIHPWFPYNSILPKSFFQYLRDCSHNNISTMLKILKSIWTNVYGAIQISHLEYYTKDSFTVSWRPYFSIP